MALLLLFALLFSSTGKRLVPVILPMGSPPPRALIVEWLDRSGASIGQQEAILEKGKLPLSPLAGAERFQVIGGGFSSRALTLAEAERLHAVPLSATGALRLSKAPADRVLTCFYVSLDEDAPPRLHRRPLIRAGDGLGRLELPAGRYALAIDAGPQSPPGLFLNLEVQPSKLLDVALPSRSGGSLELRVRDRDSRKPIAAASVEVSDSAGAAARLLATLLRTRAGRSGEDGLLRLGALPTEPLEIAIEAPGMRKARIRWRPGAAWEREVTLSPLQAIRVQVNGLPRRREDWPALMAGSCAIAEVWMPCEPDRWVRAKLDVEGRGMLRGLPPGVALVYLDWGGRKGASERVRLSADSADPDEVLLSLRLLVWRFAGKTRLRGGKPVEAKVEASGHGNNADQLAETQSAPDGSFELSFIAPAGKELTIRARSEDPPGEGEWHPPASPEGYAGEDGIEIVVRAGAFRLLLKDRSTGVPVRGCPVSARFQLREKNAEWYAKYVALKSDEDGVATFDALGGGDVHFIPKCEGYSRTEGVTFSVEPEQEREATLLLDRAADFVLTVLDARGAPLGGARVLALDIYNAHQDFRDYHDEALPVGTTNVDGRLVVKGPEWANVPFYVIVPGHALTVGRFPAAARCEGERGCDMTVRLSPPNAFAGVTLRPVADTLLRRGDPIRFSSGGMPIPIPVLSEVAALNGTGVGQLFERTADGSSLICRGFWPRGSTRSTSSSP